LPSECQDALSSSSSTIVRGELALDILALSGIWIAAGTCQQCDFSTTKMLMILVDYAGGLVIASQSAAVQWLNLLYEQKAEQPHGSFKSAPMPCRRQEM
jgi:hypothetical protein